MDEQDLETKIQQEDLFTTTLDQDEIGKDIWVIDSGATSHMVRDASWFTQLDTKTRTWLKLRSGELVQKQGKGTIYVMTELGKRNFRDVLFVPSMTHNCATHDGK